MLYPKENLTAIMIVNKKAKTMHRLRDGNTDFFDIVAGVLQGDTLVSIHVFGGARSVMVIVVGNGHGDTSSNPRPDWLHFT